MFISREELERHPVEFNTNFEIGGLDFRGTDIRQLSPLKFEGKANLIGEEIRITGQLEGRVGKPCDRCLEPTGFDLKREIDLFYRPLASIAHAEELGISDGDTSVAFYAGGSIALKDVAGEQVILSVPMKALCRADCKGLCPLCGTNRNWTACGCRMPHKVSPFEVLKKR